MRGEEQAPDLPRFAGSEGADQRMRRVGRLVGQHVEAGPGRAPGAQARGQRVEIDETPARRVDQAGETATLPFSSALFLRGKREFGRKKREMVGSRFFFLRKG